jgi:hypothetical protein
MNVSHRQAKESICSVCRSKGRDGRTIAAYWPFGEALLESLRDSDPLKGGTKRLSKRSDSANAGIIREGERQAADAMTSIDQVDYRWLSGIPTAGATRRTIDDTTFR